MYISALYLPRRTWKKKKKKEEIKGVSFYFLFLDVSRPFYQDSPQQEQKRSENKYSSHYHHKEEEKRKKERKGIYYHDGLGFQDSGMRKKGASSEEYISSRTPP